METPLTPPAPSFTAPQYQPVAPRSRAWLWWLIGVAVVVIVAAGAYWLYPWGVTGPGTSPTPSATSTPVPGDVSWQAWQKYSGADLLPHYEPCKPGECEEDHIIGTFTKGPYLGDKLVASYNLEGMGGGNWPYLFAVPASGKPVLLERDGTQYYNASGETVPFTIDRDYAIPELQIPQLLTSPDGKLVLEKQQPGFFGPNTKWDEITKGTFPLVKVFTDPTWGDVYTDSVPVTPLPTASPNMYVPVTGYNGFYVRLPSGLAAVYGERIDFLQNNELVGIRWNTGYHSGEYISTGFGGCGASDITAVVPPWQVNVSRDLVEIGRTTENEPVYFFKDVNNAYLRNIYDSQYIVIEPQVKMSYANFVDSLPVFFWADPIGRLVKFTNKTFIPPAECGKPVVYLYPRKTTKVSVHVEPVGGMTFSEPSYGSGWTVTARPDGQLTDASGVTWPYLFWEGRGGLYAQPDKGWVVAQSDVSRFLDAKLAALGLVSHEIADFKEFWLPRMQGAPYYFVSFLGNAAMNELAPLSVSPQPDTVIRILMDFSPLWEPRGATAPLIRTPARNGFTVVEWGGVIR